MSQPSSAEKEKLEVSRRSTPNPPPESLLTSKRASFVETNFFEPLKEPQFRPGQLISTPVVSTEDKLHVLQQQQEIEDLKKQIIDLNEKLEFVKAKRIEDREKLKEFERVQTQLEQAQEFKSKIMDVQSSLQRELQRARHETKEAIEAKDRHIEEMTELTENVEMITLDKEMAEEKAESLQLELDLAKEKIEELSLDLNILREEMKEHSITSAGGDMSSYEYKQLEQQNTRLRETLVRLRDLSAHDKHEIGKFQKELENKKSEIAELHRTKEKLSAKVDELEAQVVDLQVRYM